MVQVGDEAQLQAFVSETARNNGLAVSMFERIAIDCRMFGKFAGGGIANGQIKH